MTHKKKPRQRRFNFELWEGFELIERFSEDNGDNFFNTILDKYGPFRK